MPSYAGRAQPARRWGYAAAAWCLIFAALHIYWAAGGEVGLAESAGADLATRRPAAFVLFGLWGAALLLCAGAVIGVSLARARSAGLARSMISAGGWFVGAGLLARGAVVQVVLLTDAAGVASSAGQSQTTWSLALWNPWFIVGGIAFLLAASSARSRKLSSVPG